MSCFTGEYVTGTVTPEYLDWVERTSSADRRSPSANHPCGERG